MKVKSRRCLSALLAFVMLFCAAPICGSAVEESTPITEVVALREENVKHFDLGNGQYHAVSYSYPVHELDSEGNWVDINTALTTGNARIAGQYATEDGRVTVSQTFRPGSQILSMQEDGKGIAMSMVADSSNVSTFSMSRAAVENATVRSELTQYATIEEATSGDYGSRVYYEDVLPNTDLEYIVDIDMVKENIIVKAAQESYSYTFALDLTGLSAQLEDEGSVSLIDTATQERKYMIPAPYMFDAQGNTSFDAAYTLTLEGNTCYLTVTADAEWINAQGRQFPVTIDPSIMGVAEPAADTYIDSETPGINYGDSRPLWVRSTRATYIKCANINLPENATLDYASLAVFYGYVIPMSGGYVNVKAYRVDSPWNERTLTWNVAAQDPDLLMDLSQMHFENDLEAGEDRTLATPTQVDFFITPVVRAWLYEGYTNYGIGLKYGGGDHWSVTFKSSETESIYRPRINYKYTIYSGGGNGWPTAAKPNINSRNDWSAAAVANDRLAARTRSPQRIIFHHSAEKFDSINTNEIINEIKRIQTLHMDQNGKCDIAYHFIIDPAGGIWQGAEIDGYQRGHAEGYFDDIGILILGDFESRAANGWNPNVLNDNQKSAMQSLAKWLCYCYNLSTEAHHAPITTHRSVNETECPGENAGPWIEITLSAMILEWKNQN